MGTGLAEASLGVAQGVALVSLLASLCCQRHPNDEAPQHALATASLLAENLGCRFSGGPVALQCFCSTCPPHTKFLTTEY